jgi:hypothetical protein
MLADAAPVVGQSDGVSWEASLALARERARTEGKPLLIDLRSAPATTASLWLDTVTYRHPRVASLISEHFVPVKVAVTEKGEVANRYGANRGPAIIVGGGGGEPHYCVNGRVSPEEFIAQLRLALGRYRFDRGEFAQAVRHFEQVVHCHAATGAAVQALFWLGLAEYLHLTRAGRAG